ncbi:MAG: translesion error-prone DNA polymerase V autoproteolytic subunit [Deltaproteobacteria bacterium]|jgi:DNA polymerase V|nr:translesion error-prone DNA polymerase V autoproteolytic subunit [Deltaproteobacteria bacterium]
MAATKMDAAGEAGGAGGRAGNGGAGAAAAGREGPELPGAAGFAVFAPEETEPGRPGLPLFLVPVSAGFPSPAEDYVQEQLDLHRLVVKNPPATFFLRVKGDSMRGAGIHDGDLLVVDRSRSPGSGSIVVAAWEGELTVKRLKLKGKRVFLAPDNPDYPEFDITESEDAVVWGVVTYVVHKL